MFAKDIFDINSAFPAGRVIVYHAPTRGLRDAYPLPNGFLNALSHSHFLKKVSALHVAEFKSISTSGATETYKGVYEELVAQAL